ncbi:MAG: hypothetical protein WCK53_01480 [Methanomicrobiales archaeon]
MDIIIVQSLFLKIANIFPAIEKLHTIVDTFQHHAGRYFYPNSGKKFRSIKKSKLLTALRLRNGAPPRKRLYVLDRTILLTLIWNWFSGMKMDRGNHANTGPGLRYYEAVHHRDVMYPVDVEFRIGTRVKLID